MVHHIPEPKSVTVRHSIEPTTNIIDPDKQGLQVSSYKGKSAQKNGVYQSEPRGPRGKPSVNKQL
jgi:hypothetical protein